MSNANHDDEQAPKSWEQAPEDRAPADVPAELALDADLHTPEEAGYGYGV
jgi:hypothetical protein